MSEEYRGYGKLLGKLTKKEEILEKLSEIDDNLNYRENITMDEVLNKIIDFLEEERDAALDLDMSKETEQLDFVIKTCNEYLTLEKEQEQSEELTAEELSPKQIVFAKSKSGNNYFKKDLKKIKYSKEVYGEIVDVIDFISSGRKPNRNTMARKLNNNGNFDNVFEYKGNQVRIYTRNLNDNIICIIGIKIKKGNNPKGIHDYLSKRCKNLHNDKIIEELEKIISSEDKDKLLEESREELDKIMTELNVDAKEEPKEPALAIEKLEEEIIPVVTDEMLVPKEITEMPVITNKRNEKWLEKYKLAKKYYESHGNLNIPSSYIDAATGIKLGGWFHNQKYIYKKGNMPPERAEMLEEIGMFLPVVPVKSQKIETLELYPQKEETLPKTNQPTIEPEIHTTPKEQMISEIVPRLNDLSLETLSKIKSIIKLSKTENEIINLYEGLLQMNQNELDEFMLVLENVPLSSGKKK